MQPINPPLITDEMFQALCSCEMSEPVALKDADLTLPFLYERQWGVFYTPAGYHLAGMKLLLAWQQGMVRPVDIVNKLGLREHEVGEYWLQHTDGAAFRSSVGKFVITATTGRDSRLNTEELAAFGRVVGID